MKNHKYLLTIYVFDTSKQLKNLEMIKKLTVKKFLLSNFEIVQTLASDHFLFHIKNLIYKLLISD